MITLFEKLFHLAAKIFLIVLELLVVKADVGIAGHRQNAAFLHCVSIEQRRQPAQKNRFCTHKAFSVGEQKKRRCAVRHRHNADCLMSLFAFQQRCGIEVLVDQMRRRMVRPEENRRENRKKLRFEKAVDLL